MDVEVVGGVGRNPASADEVVDYRNVRGAGHVRHGISSPPVGKRSL
jgi:hypothetical protein